MVQRKPLRYVLIQQIEYFFKALNHHHNSGIVSEAFARLTSRNASFAWTSGQWMTEKKGGSDVAGGCDTYAIKCEGEEDQNKYRLFGYKWFTSTTDSEMTLTLARIVDANGATIPVSVYRSIAQFRSYFLGIKRNIIILRSTI